MHEHLNLIGNTQNNYDYPLKGNNKISPRLIHKTPKLVRSTSPKINKESNYKCSNKKYLNSDLKNKITSRSKSSIHGNYSNRSNYISSIDHTSSNNTNKLSPLIKKIRD